MQVEDIEKMENMDLIDAYTTRNRTQKEKENEYIIPDYSGLRRSH